MHKSVLTKFVRPVRASVRGKNPTHSQERANSYNTYNSYTTPLIYVRSPLRNVNNICKCCKRCKCCKKNIIFQCFKLLQRDLQPLTKTTIPSKSPKTL